MAAPWRERTGERVRGATSDQRHAIIVWDGVWDEKRKSLTGHGRICPNPPVPNRIRRKAEPADEKPHRPIWEAGMRSAPRMLAVVALFGLFQAIAPHGAAAQSYPARPITLIVPYPAGGPSEVRPTTSHRCLFCTGERDSWRLISACLVPTLRESRVKARRIAPC